MESNRATYDVKERRNMLSRQRRASLIDAHRESNNITQHTRCAARVEGQPLEERIVALQRDKKRVAHRRAGGDRYYVAYKPITLSYILFMFIEMKFIHCHFCVMLAMKSMSMCND